VVGQQNADITDTLQLRDIAMATTFGFLYMGAYWRHLTNTTEPSVCCGDVTLCQITLTTCFLKIFQKQPLAMFGKVFIWWIPIMLALKKTQSSEPQQTTKNKPRVSVFVDLPNDK